MFGTWRWFLAILVVVGHLYHPWWPASFGVFSFYILSGFLMTVIINEHYGYSLSGFKGFWINRFLRLYPSYFLACLISMAVIISIPSEFVTNLNNKMILPNSAVEVLTNITILGLQEIPDKSSLVPPAWALSIEIVYYLVISLWAGRSQSNALLFLLLSITYLAAVYILKDFNWRYRYYHVGAGSLPFAVGTNIYFLRNQFKKYINYISWPNAFFISIAIYASVFAAAIMAGQTRTTFFYLNILSSSLLLLVLWNSPAISFKKIDSFLGDLSYPTYLIHWQIAIFITYFTGLSFKGWKLLIVTTLIVTSLSIFDARTVSGPIEQYRKNIKRSLSG